MVFHIDPSTCSTSSLWLLFCWSSCCGFFSCFWVSLYASSFPIPTSTCRSCLCEFQLILISESIYTDYYIHFQMHQPSAPPLFNSFRANPPVVSVAAPVPIHPEVVPSLFTSFAVNPTSAPAPPVAAPAPAHPQGVASLFTSFSVNPTLPPAPPTPAPSHSQRVPHFISVNPALSPAPPVASLTPAPEHPQRAPLFTTFSANPALPPAPPVAPSTPAPTHPQRAPLFTTFSANPALPHNDVANIRWARKSARANCSISSVERAWTHRV